MTKTITLILSVLIATPALADWEPTPKEETTSHADNKLEVKFYKDAVRAKKEALEHGCDTFSRKDEPGAVVICGRKVETTMVLVSMEQD